MEDEPLKKTFHPMLSVITIVYNNVRDIERTLRSVLRQTYSPIEYIVVDGGSTDGTLEIIQKYADRISKLISEPDEGIYDAMNKGLAAATGDYVLFMNSGDEIYDSFTVGKIFATAANADIYYGETELYDDNWQRVGMRRHSVPEKFTWKSFKYGMNISHQAIYVKRSIAPFYDRQFQLSADVDWVIKTAKKANKIINTKQIVAKYLIGGMSQKRHRQSLKERFIILSRHYGLIPNCINHVVILFRLLAYTFRHGKPKD